MRKTLNRNHYFVFGFLLGLFLSFYIPEDVWELVQEECPHSTENFIEKFGEDFEPHLNLVNKPLAAKKPVKNVIRPRYYSSELGIREKVFVGVLTSFENVETLATAFNKTVAHLVNKIKYFINAENMKGNFQLKNIIGFTDTREHLKPFHILKYVADNYLDDYDYFVLVPDTTYIDARKLQALLYHLSISFDIYMGRKCEAGDLDKLGIQNERSYCDLDAGIVLSSSVIRKIRANLDWCVRNAVTNYHSINIGKCVKYSSKVSECQESFQGINIPSYKLTTTKLYKDLKILSANEEFNNATFIFPVTSVDDLYITHAYFSKLNLNELKRKSEELETKSYHIANGTISNNILELSWPLGIPPQSTPETRHDVLVWQFLNTTHMFMPNHEIIVAPLSRIDSEDMNKILNKTIEFSHKRYENLKFLNLHTAYRRFDPVRGMDYHLHLNFNDEKNGKIVLKSFEVMKPLGRIEVVPSPYVTESTRIAILLPTFEHQTRETAEFIKQYEKTCMENQDNTFLLLVFLYRADADSKGDNDAFKSIKATAQVLTNKFKSDGSRIAWLSIRLPQEFSEVPVADVLMINSIFGRNEILSLAVADLGLRKIGLDSLVMIGSNSMSFKSDFLNRVRMNTIQGFQIFAPIGFMMYPCNLAHFCKDCESCDVAQSSGYFDKFNYDVISFYSRDYVNARKKIESSVPIVRTDQDIGSLLKRTDKSVKNVLDMFVAATLELHILRGVEPNLRFGRSVKNFIERGSGIPTCPTLTAEFGGSFFNPDKCVHLASRKQIGDAIVKYEEVITS